MEQRRKKRLTGLLFVMLTLAISIGTTLAFLADSQRMVNTFALGEIDISLEEPKYPHPGEDVPVQPGDNFPKDPTIEARQGNTYMRAVVTFLENDPNSKNYQQVITDPVRAAKILSTIYFDPDNALLTGAGGKFSETALSQMPHFNSTDFTYDSSRSTVSNIVLNYNGIFAENDVAVVFTTVVLPSNFNQKDMDILGKYQIVITAEAIQAEVFDDHERAFSALDNKILDGTMSVNYKELTLSYNAPAESQSDQ